VYPCAIAGWVFDQERNQADCFVAKFGPDQVLAAGGFVHFVEEQVKGVQYAV
jgi:hypothetical protein